MNFEWEHYICLACKLIKSPNFILFHDASLRSAMSRSYYGVYGVASTYLLEHRGVPNLPSQDPHKFVREKFKSSSNEQEIQIGEQLSRLWRGRKNADYDDVFEVNSSNAERNLFIAMTAIINLKNMGKKHSTRK